MSAYSIAPQSMMSGPPASNTAGLGISATPASGARTEPGVPAAQQAETASPAQNKKGRTNTPWTPGEELRLKGMRDAGKSWSEIAKTFPNRTEGSVKKHWYKVSRALSDDTFLSISG